MFNVRQTAFVRVCVNKMVLKGYKYTTYIFAHIHIKHIICTHVFIEGFSRMYVHTYLIGLPKCIS